SKICFVTDFGYISRPIGQNLGDHVQQVLYEAVQASTNIVNLAGIAPLHKLLHASASQPSALLRVRFGCATHRGYRTEGHRLVAHRTIQTLHPDLLLPSDFVDLQRQKAILYVQSRSDASTVYLNYHSNPRNGKSSRVLFPSNATGFLYLHRPPSLPSIAAQIRLRITPEPDPDLFSIGADLLRGPRPWSIHLPQIVTSDMYAPFKAQIASDGLLDGGFMDSLKLAWQDCANLLPDTQTIVTLTQPFEINLEDTATFIRILTTGTQRRIIFQGLFVDHRQTHTASQSPYKYPYKGTALPSQLLESVLTSTHSGRILAHVETSPLPKHARPASRRPVLVLRILKILTPVEAVPGYDMFLPIPEEGGLLSKATTGPMAFDLEKPPQCLKDLQLLWE
ncbi:hypothetical protein DXG03_008620, partial [Asterophora parasitica]